MTGLDSMSHEIKYTAFIGNYGFYMLPTFIY